MTLGVADPQGNLLDDMSAFCDKTLATRLDLRVLAPRAGAALPRQCLRGSVLRRRSALGPSLGRRDRDGAAAPGRPVGP